MSGKVEVNQISAGGSTAFGIKVKTEEGKKCEVGVNAFSNGTIALFPVSGSYRVVYDNKKPKGRNISVGTMVHNLMREIQEEMVDKMDEDDYEAMVRFIERKTEFMVREHMSQRVSIHVEAI